MNLYYVFPLEFNSYDIINQNFTNVTNLLIQYMNILVWILDYYFPFFLY